MEMQLKCSHIRPMLSSLNIGIVTRNVATQLNPVNDCFLPELYKNVIWVYFVKKKNSFGWANLFQDTFDTIG